MFTFALNSDTQSALALCRPCTRRHRPCEFLCVSATLFSEVLFPSVCPPSYLVLTIFLFPLLQGFLSPEGERSEGKIPFGTECSKVSHSLAIVQLWVHLSVHIYDIYCKWELLCCWLSSTLIPEYIRRYSIAEFL